MTQAIPEFTDLYLRMTALVQIIRDLGYPHSTPRREFMRMVGAWGTMALWAWAGYQGGGGWPGAVLAGLLLGRLALGGPTEYCQLD